MWQRGAEKRISRVCPRDSWGSAPTLRWGFMLNGRRYWVPADCSRQRRYGQLFSQDVDAVRTEEYCKSRNRGVPKVPPQGKRMWSLQSAPGWMDYSFISVCIRVVNIYSIYSIYNIYMKHISIPGAPKKNPNSIFQFFHLRKTVRWRERDD